MSGRSRLSCDAASGLAPLYVLRALDLPTEQAVREHVTTCDQPHPEFLELGGVMPYLAESPEPVEPPGHLRDRILAAAAAERRAQPLKETAADQLVAVIGTDQTRRPGQPPGKIGTVLSRRPAMRVLLAAAAVIVLLAGLGTWNLALQQQVGAARSRADELSAVIRAAIASGAVPDRLAGTSAAPGAQGIAVLPQLGPGYLVVQGLPPAPAGRTYEAWFIAGGTPRPAGTFEIGSDGIGVLAGLRTSGSVETVAVTEEAAGGAPLPTGPVLVAGHVTS